MPGFDNRNAALVTVAPGKNPRELYEHQLDAMQALSRMNERKEFSTILVLPTGAGKTLTAVYWLLKNAVNARKKVLWLAHRHLLLDQAAEAFVSNGYADLLPDRLTYRYRIVSGMHDRPVHITGDEDILIAGKDSIIKRLSVLDEWMEDGDIYLVVDEAHHAVARTYRRIIDYVRDASKKRGAHVKLLGLTATPYRTDEAEKAALGELFPDDILYSIDLDTLIKRGILSTPVLRSFETHLPAGGSVTESAARRIAFSDNLPEDLADAIAGSSERNRLIVKTYLDGRRDYEQTLVFALNIRHAIELNAVFRKHGVRSGYIVSDVRDAVTGVTVSREENEKRIEAYRNKELEVLINVNILTEGTDLPQTKTVFLTRPTVSRVLMTQMVGRALRGVRAGGTKTAYIVSFVDDWEEKIAFESPETVLLEGTAPPMRKSARSAREVRNIAISLIEEFARIADDTVDTRRLEALPFSERIPVGMYMLSWLEEDPENERSMERSRSVLVYNSSERAYSAFLSEISGLLRSFGVTGERIDNETLERVIRAARDRFFREVLLPPCRDADIEALLKAYAYSGRVPALIPFDEVDREKVNLSYIAQDMLERRLDDYQKKDYLDALWNDDETLLRLYYSEFEYFKRQLDKEVYKIVYGVASVLPPSVEYEKRPPEKMTMRQLWECDPVRARALTEAVFGAARYGDGWRCQMCGMISPHRVDFQIDHIMPMSEGGLTVPENLQLLCRRCNVVIKNDRYIPAQDTPPLSGEAMPGTELTGSMLTVRLGAEEKHFALTPMRKRRGCLTFTIGGAEYRYNIRGGKLERLSE